MARKTAEVFIQEIGVSNEFDVSIAETNNALASNVTVEFKAYSRDLTPSGEKIEEPGVTISSVTVPIGSFANGVWTIGNMQNVSYTGTFAFTLDDPEVSNVTIEAVASNGTLEVNTSDNIKEKEYIGLRKEIIPATTLFSTVERDTGTTYGEVGSYYGPRKVYVRVYKIYIGDWTDFGLIYNLGLPKDNILNILHHEGMEEFQQPGLTDYYRADYTLKATTEEANLFIQLNNNLIAGQVVTFTIYYTYENEE